MNETKCKYHCRCMNLDKSCPNPHYLDSKCTCPRPDKPKCEEHDLKLIGFLSNTICIKCNNELTANEIEIFGEFHEVGGYCDNKECERYLILVV